MNAFKGECVLVAASSDPVPAAVEQAAQEHAHRLGLPVVYSPVMDAPESARSVMFDARAKDAALIVAEPGPVAMALARSASSPVLVARASPPGTVIAATDLSDPDLPALRFAASEARARGSPLCFFHAVSGKWIDDIAEPGTAAFTKLSQAQVESAKADLTHYRERLHPGAQVRAELAEPLEGIQQLSSSMGARLIVVATRRRSALLGHPCLAEQLVADAPCSVLVVKKRRRPFGIWLVDQRFA